MRSAALWYEERPDGLGDRFIAAVLAALERIGKTPDAFPAWPGVQHQAPVVRKALVSRFSYLIAFEQHEHSILVLGIAHARRRPLYWLARGGHGPG